MANSTAEAIQQIRKAAGQGDAHIAWPLIETILRFPESQNSSVDELAATWAYFQKSVNGLNMSSLAPLIEKARDNPDDVRALLALGKELLHHDLGAVAATPLRHASRLIDKNNPLAGEIANALAVALESTTAS